MNNKERYIWIALLILACLFCDRKMAQIESLNSVMDHNSVRSKIQSDQIQEMLLSYNSLASSEYKKGFEDGKTHALISVIHEEEVNSYADGYHAAISQMQSLKVDPTLINKMVKSSKNDN